MPITLPPDQFITVNGLRIRYVEAGSGTPLLLLHGLGNSSLVWHKVIAPLAQHARVLAIDLPGHGFSDIPTKRYTTADAAAFLSGFMDALRLDRATIVGNSLGGSVAMETALVHPQRVSGLVLVDSAGLGREIAWFLRFGSIKRLGEYFERPTLKHMQAMARALMYDPSKIDQELLLDMARFRGRPGATPFMLELLRYGVTPFGQRRHIQRTHLLHTLTSPLLVLWGKQDRLFPAWHGERAARSRPPHSSLHLFEHCGHWPELEHPAEFTTVVAAFLKALPTPLEAGASRR